MAKEEICIPDHSYGTPKQPGMSVARLEVWESYRCRIIFTRKSAPSDSQPDWPTLAISLIAT